MPDNFEHNVPGFPAPHKYLFKGGIVHPDLWLWDSWCFKSGGVSHLYCLALSRQTASGRPISPHERNNYPFHIRHFTSDDHGSNWKDCGLFQSLSADTDSYYNRNVWSGSVKPAPGSGYIAGFTGIRLLDEDHEFLQSIGVGFSREGNTLDSVQSTPLSCPKRDYDDIIDAGYYLGSRDDLGANSGENNGPILAWRDPFTFVSARGTVHMFWSAKVSAREGAIAHAEIVMKNGEYRISKLHPPIRLPDGADITQAEVPKLIHDDKNKLYYLLISACNRLHEKQPDSEVSKTSRLYKSDNLRGPWAPYLDDTSVIPGFENCFGASILRADFDNQVLHLICPITEKAEPAKQLSIAPIKTVSLK